MNREKVREYKRAVRMAIEANASGPIAVRARECAVALLDRSIQCGHDRLAILRLVAAVRVGANISSQHWEYCNAVARRFDGKALEEIIERGGE